MKMKLTMATWIAGAALAVAPCVVQATPELTLTIGANAPQTFTSGSSFGAQNVSSNGVTVNVSGASNIASASGTDNNINANSINVTNTTGSTQTLAIDIQDTGFIANGTLNNELYNAQESFGGEIALGTASFVFTTTATPNNPANHSSATVSYSSQTYSTSSTPFSVPDQTSANTLVLSPGDGFTIDSNMVITLSANASANLDILNDNTISTVVPTGTATPEPASAGLAMAGLLPMFFLRRRKA